MNYMNGQWLIRTEVRLGENNRSGQQWAGAMSQMHRLGRWEPARSQSHPQSLRSSSSLSSLAASSSKRWRVRSNRSAWDSNFRAAVDAPAPSCCCSSSSKLPGVSDAAACCPTIRIWSSACWTMCSWNWNSVIFQRYISLPFSRHWHSRRCSHQTELNQAAEALEACTATIHFHHQQHPLARRPLASDWSRRWCADPRMWPFVWTALEVHLSDPCPHRQADMHLIRWIPSHPRESTHSGSCHQKLKKQFMLNPLNSKIRPFSVDCAGTSSKCSCAGDSSTAFSVLSSSTEIACPSIAELSTQSVLSSCVDCSSSCTSSACCVWTSLTKNLQFMALITIKNKPLAQLSHSHSGALPSTAHWLVFACSSVLPAICCVFWLASDFESAGEQHPVPAAEKRAADRSFARPQLHGTTPPFSCQAGWSTQCRSATLRWQCRTSSTSKNTFVSEIKLSVCD